MKHRLWHFLVLIPVLSLAMAGCDTTDSEEEGPPIDQPEAPIEGYNLAWSDEFDGDALDPRDWSIRHEFDWWGDSHTAHYIRDNVDVSDGTLKLWVRGERYKDRNYTGALVDTQGKQWWMENFYMEGRVRYNVETEGFWGNFFTFGAIPGTGEHKWPPEYDMAEMTSNHEGEIIQVNHYDRGGHRSDDEWTNLDWSEWHTYAVHHTPEEVTFFIDGRPTFTSPFVEDAHYIMLRMGTAHSNGNWGGNPRLATFPVNAEFDWIRVWKPREE